MPHSIELAAARRFKGGIDRVALESQIQIIIGSGLALERERRSPALVSAEIQQVSFASGEYFRYFRIRVAASSRNHYDDP